jgi:(p)ppGpp synthase/HD superfamily hydrolase
VKRGLPRGDFAVWKSIHRIGIRTSLPIRKHQKASMNDIVRIMKAADFAARRHTRQRRKGAAAEPYLNHLIEVADLVAEATDGSADAVVAALLHDAVEDQGVEIEEIADLFGATVASVVAELTDDKTLPKQERKDKQIESAPHKSDTASIIKLADKTSNLRALATSPPPWTVERKREYIRWARAVVARLPSKPSALLATFEDAANRAADAAK